MNISIYWALIGRLLHAKHCAGGFDTSISDHTSHGRIVLTFSAEETKIQNG